METRVQTTDVVPVRLSNVEIEEVLVNLMRNAIESNPKHPVHVSLSLEGDDAIIRVVDDGVGIPVELTKRVFDPFFTTRLRDGGSGLGLSVVHGIVTEHGGEIEVESEPGAGTRIALRFPIAQRTAPPRRRGPSSDPPQLAV